MTTASGRVDTTLRAEIYAETAPVLRVLAHADRLRIVDVLMRRRLPVADLARALKLAPNAVSQHLNLMQARGIVDKTRRGRRVYYKVVHPAARSLLKCMWRSAENREQGIGTRE